MTEGTEKHATALATEARALTADDLIVDLALGPEDRDALQHRPIVNRVAELVAVSATPANVALFASWGAGKSSFAHLLQGRLAEQFPKVALVTYDSWTFEGESLQRSFISAVATGLNLPGDNPEYVEFHSGLYERRRSARLTLSRADVIKLLVVALGLFGMTLAFLFLLVAALAWLFGQDPVESAVAALPALIPVTAVAGLLGSVTREIIAGARIDVDIGAPTQEQFRSTFKRLVAAARAKYHLDRVVFFIDELDRCSPEQVVQVLAAVRHFFDHPGCVFIVAADRDVIESALQRKSSHTAPFNSETPYYSSASEYIDKVFQHQLALPPLRGRRLTRFARDIVEQKQAGLWVELQRDGADRLRDQVIYVLIPSHVRSPRRVKVLLNNFATTARIAQARGIDIVKHGNAIAKLTALRTEFPLFAADLYVEPRLPTMLLTPPAAPSPRLAALLQRHSLPNPGAAPGTAQDLTPTDQVLTATDEAAERRLIQAERDNLRRYLVRTLHFPDPSKDLLFLEPAGAADDLTDSAFGELLEGSSVEAPDDVVTAASDQPAEERAKAMRVLADLIVQEFGQERSNVTTTLLGIARLQEYNVTPYEQEVLDALRLQLREEGLEPEHLAPALAVAAVAERIDHELSDAILADERLMSDADHVERIALVAAGIDEARRAPIWAKVAEFYPDSPEVIDQPLATLPEPVAKELLETRSLRTAMLIRYNALSAADAEEEIDGILALFATRDDSSERLRGSLLLAMVEMTGNTYAAAFRHRQDLNKFASRPGWRNAIAMRGIVIGPAANWQEWADLIAPGTAPFINEASRATGAIASVLKRWPEAAGMEDQSATVLARIVKLVPDASDAAFQAAATPQAQAALGSTTWWTTAPAASAQSNVHRALLELCSVGPATGAALRELVVADLESSFVPQPTPHSLEATRAAIGSLDLADLGQLSQTLAGLPAQPAPLNTDVPQTRLAIATIVKDLGEDVQVAPYAVSPDEMIVMLTGPDRGRNLTSWFALGPSYAGGSKVAHEIGLGASTQDRSAIAAWARTIAESEHTDLLLDLTGLADDTSAWVESLASEPVDEPRLLRSLDQRLRQASRGDVRNDLARTIAAVRPRTRAGQRVVAELVVWLLTQGKKVDFDAAVVLVPALGDDHRMGRDLATAFTEAANRGYKIPDRAIDDLRRAKVAFRKRGLPEELWRRFRGR